MFNYKQGKFWFLLIVVFILGVLSSSKLFPQKPLISPIPLSPISEKVVYVNTDEEKLKSLLRTDDEIFQISSEIITIGSLAVKDMANSNYKNIDIYVNQINTYNARLKELVPIRNSIIVSLGIHN